MTWELGWNGKPETPASMRNNLDKVEGHTLYGKKIMDYTKEELAAFIIYQKEQQEKMGEEKSRQIQNIISIIKRRL